MLLWLVVIAATNSQPAVTANKFQVIVVNWFDHSALDI
jgi:hypothetical protein